MRPCSPGTGLSLEWVLVLAPGSSCPSDAPCSAPAGLPVTETRGPLNPTGLRSPPPLWWEAGGVTFTWWLFWVQEPSHPLLPALPSLQCAFQPHESKTAALSSVITSIVQEGKREGRKEKKKLLFFNQVGHGLASASSPSSTGSRGHLQL